MKKKKNGNVYTIMPIKDKFKEHSKHHSKKHIDFMKKFIRAGKGCFSQAHKAAQKKVGK